MSKLGSKFFREAMNTEGSFAYQAAVAYCRISSRPEELAGANAPLSYSVTLMQAAAPPQLNSTQQIALAIARVKGENPTEEEIRREWSNNELERHPAETPNSRISEVIDNLRATSPVKGEGGAN